MISRRQIGLNTFAGLATLGLGGCTKIFGDNSADDSKTISFWAMGSEGEMVGKLLPKFSAENPDIKVIVQKLPWSAAHEKLLTAFAGNTMPDISQMGNSWIPEMVAIGAISPLDEIAQTLEKGDYFQGIWDTNVIDNKIYGIPWYVDTRLLFYRTDTLSRAGYNSVPETWDKWHAAMKKIKSNIGDKRYSILMPLNEYEPLVTLALQVDDPILKDNASRGNMNSAGFKKALGFYKSMFDEKLAPTAAAAEISNVHHEFGRGFFNFYITGPWQIGEMKRRLPEEVQGDWATSQMPGPNGYGASSAGGSSLVLIKNSKKKEASTKLLAFLSRPEIQREFFDLTGDLPARKSAWDMGNLRNDKYASAFYKQLELSKPTPKAPEWERIAQDMRIVAEQMIRSGESVETAANLMQTRADKILEKRRYLLARGGH